MEKLVAIIDKVPEYGRRLAVYLNAGRNFPYRAVVFSSGKEAERCMNNGGVYAVLVSEDMESEVIHLIAGTNIKLFRLCENREEQGSFSLYRYSSAKELERCLVEEKKEKRKIPVIGFFSPPGGCEAEELSQSIARGLGRSGKVLFISAFPFGLMGRGRGDGLSEVLYFIRQTGKDRTEQLRKIPYREEYADCIGPVRWYTDLCNVTREDIRELLQGDLWNGEYRAFFVGVGMFDCVGQDILSFCDGVLMPVWETARGQELQEEFRRQIKESGNTKLYSGIREFAIKSEDTGFEEAVAEAVKKGEEIIEQCGRGASQTDFGTAGSDRGADG